MNCAMKLMRHGREGKKRILLTGTCWYELNGLEHLLSAQGYDTCQTMKQTSLSAVGFDLVIVALSAEPIAGWGRHLSWICELREQMCGEMLVLVPVKLRALTILRHVCPVCSGDVCFQRLKVHICAALARESVQTNRISLTDGQRRAIKVFSERDGNRQLDQKWSEYGLRWHYARMADNIGVRDFRILKLVGLDKEIIRMEKIQNIS